MDSWVMRGICTATMGRGIGKLLANVGADEFGRGDCGRPVPSFFLYNHLMKPILYAFLGLVLLLIVNAFLS